MSRILSSLLAILMLLTASLGCGSDTGNQPSNNTPRTDAGDASSSDTDAGPDLSDADLSDVDEECFGYASASLELVKQEDSGTTTFTTPALSEVHEVASIADNLNPHLEWVHVRNEAVSSRVTVEDRVNNDSWNEVSFKIRRDGELVEQDFVVGEPGSDHFYSVDFDALPHDAEFEVEFSGGERAMFVAFLTNQYEAMYLREDCIQHI